MGNLRAPAWEATGARPPLTLPLAAGLGAFGPTGAQNLVARRSLPRLVCGAHDQRSWLGQLEEGASVPAAFSFSWEDPSKTLSRSRSSSPRSNSAQVSWGADGIHSFGAAEETWQKGSNAKYFQQPEMGRQGYVNKGGNSPGNRLSSVAVFSNQAPERP